MNVVGEVAWSEGEQSVVDSVEARLQPVDKCAVQRPVEHLGQLSAGVHLMVSIVRVNTREDRRGVGEDVVGAGDVSQYVVGVGQ